MDVLGDVTYDGTFKEEESYKFRSIVNHDHFLNYGVRHIRGHAPKGGTISFNAAKHLPDILEVPQNGFALDGYAIGTDGRRLTEVLLHEASAGGLSSTKSRDKSDEYTIAGPTPYGRISVILREDGALLGFTYKKSPNDVFAPGKKVSDLNHIGLVDNSTGLDIDGPKGAMQQWEQTLTDIVFKDVSGTIFPATGVLKETWHLVNGQAIIGVNAITREAIALSPTQFAENAFQASELANGAQLTDVDQPNAGVIYTWNNGKVETLFQHVPTAVPESEAATSKVASRTWLILGNLAVTTIAAVVLFRFLRKTV